MACKDVNVQEAAELLKNAKRVLILCHQKPDGDTLGCGFAMLHTLKKLGKTARIDCSDSFTPKYDMLYGNPPVDQPDFNPDFVLAVDVADARLLGEKTSGWADKVDLCIDHHPSNTRYANMLLLNPRSAATVEIVALVIEAMGAEIDKQIATCLYTGLVTDTGCFRYSSVTPETMRLGARLLECGVNGFAINKRMFETKSPARIDMERFVMDTLEYDFEKRYATIVMSIADIKRANATEDDLEGVATIPRQIEGVDVSAAFKEKEKDVYRVSMRSGLLVDVSHICMDFGGGGHARAAGCTIEAPLVRAKEILRERVGKELGLVNRE